MYFILTLQKSLYPAFKGFLIVIKFMHTSCVCVAFGGLWAPKFSLSSPLKQICFCSWGRLY